MALNVGENGGNQNVKRRPNSGVTMIPFLEGRKRFSDRSFLIVTKRQSRLFFDYRGVEQP
jgi:hypothetical protein